MAEHRIGRDVRTHTRWDVDNGPVLGTTTVPILPDDTLESLTARVHRAEHELLVATLTPLCRQEVRQ